MEDFKRESTSETNVETVLKDPQNPTVETMLKIISSRSVSLA